MLEQSKDVVADLLMTSHPLKPVDTLWSRCSSSWPWLFPLSSSCSCSGRSVARSINPSRAGRGSFLAGWCWSSSWRRYSISTAGCSQDFLLASPRPPMDSGAGSTPPGDAYASCGAVVDYSRYGQTVRGSPALLGGSLQLPSSSARGWAPTRPTDRKLKSTFCASASGARPPGAPGGTH